LKQHFYFKGWITLVLGLLLIVVLPLSSSAARMVGKVVVLGSELPLKEVTITNVHTAQEIKTDNEGLFVLEVKKGELVEFRKAGFEVARVRVKTDSLAKYYYIQLKLQPTTIESQLTHDYFMGARIDSIKRRELYQQALDHYQLTGLDIIQHPFDAMSKRNQMIWAFQKNYEIWEREKFVDYVFNDRLIVQLTGLEVGDIEEYKYRYRPRYELIRGMKEYEFYAYIKNTVKDFKRIRRQEQENKNNPVDQYNYDR
jgi:hypothetical protein